MHKNGTKYKTTVIINCLECKQEFKVAPYLKNKRKYCSHNCSTKKLSDYNKNKKYSYEDVYNYFVQQECVLLDSEYINYHHKMTYQCKCGNISEINFAHFKAGKRCKKCAGTESPQQKNIELFFKQNGCTLLSLYKNHYDYLSFKCKCGELGERSYYNFKSHPYCRKCAGRTEYSIEYIKNYFIEHGCVLLATEYTNQDCSMPYICECGKKRKISWRNFKLGKRCKSCGSKKYSGDKHFNWNTDREYINLRKIISARATKMVRRIFTEFNTTKKDSTHNILGYTRKELYLHIVEHPNWNNIDRSLKWEIDHIFPVSAFVEHNITDMKIINALDNLQPLQKSDNRDKSNIYDKHEFILYLNKKGLEDPRKTGLKNGLRQLTKEQLQKVLDYPGEFILDKFNYHDGKFCPLAIALDLDKTMIDPTHEKVYSELVKLNYTVYNTRGIKGEFYTTNRHEDFIMAAKEVLNEKCMF